jgi:hypothetical protein
VRQHGCASRAPRCRTGRASARENAPRGNPPLDGGLRSLRCGWRLVWLAVCVAERSRSLACNAANDIRARACETRASHRASTYTHTCISTPHVRSSDARDGGTIPYRTALPGPRPSAYPTGTPVRTGTGTGTGTPYGECKFGVTVQDRVADRTTRCAKEINKKRKPDACTDLLLDCTQR